MIYLKILYWILIILFVTSQIGDILSNRFKKISIFPNLVIGNIFFVAYMYCISMVSYVILKLFQIQSNYLINIIPLLQNIVTISLWLFIIGALFWFFYNHIYIKKKKIQIFKIEYLLSITLVIIFFTFSFEFLSNEIADGYLYINTTFNYTNNTTLTQYNNYLNENNVLINLKFINENKWYISNSFWIHFFNIKWYFEQRIFIHFVIGILNICVFSSLLISIFKYFKIPEKYIFLCVGVSLIFLSWDIGKLFFLPMFISYYNKYILIPIIFTITYDKSFLKSIIIDIIFELIFGFSHSILEILLIIIIFYKLYVLIKERNIVPKKYFDIIITIIFIVILSLINLYIYKNSNYGFYDNLCMSMMQFSFSNICGPRELLHFSSYYSWMLVLIPIISIYFFYNNQKEDTKFINFSLHIVNFIIILFYCQSIANKIDSLEYLLGFVFIRILSYFLIIIIVFILKNLYEKQNKKIAYFVLFIFITSNGFYTFINRLNSYTISSITKNSIYFFNSNGINNEQYIEKYIKKNNLYFNSVFITNIEKENWFTNTRKNISPTNHTTYPKKYIEDLKENKVLKTKNVFVSKESYESMKINTKFRTSKEIDNVFSSKKYKYQKTIKIYYKKGKYKKFYKFIKE